MFAKADFRCLADQLAGLRGRFLLSLNDVPEVRSIFAAFHLTEARTTYTISARRNDQAGTRPELLISNWTLPTCQEGR